MTSFSGGRRLGNAQRRTRRHLSSSGGGVGLPVGTSGDRGRSRPAPGPPLSSASGVSCKDCSFHGHGDLHDPGGLCLPHRDHRPSAVGPCAAREASLLGRIGPRRRSRGCRRLLETLRKGHPLDLSCRNLAGADPAPLSSPRETSRRGPSPSPTFRGISGHFLHRPVQRDSGSGGGAFSFTLF